MVTTSGSVVNYAESGAPVIVDGHASAFDADSADIDGGKMTVKIASGSQSTDRLDLDHSGLISVSAATSQVSSKGEVVGTFAGTTTLTLNASATPAAVEELLRHVTFSSISQAPSTTLRSITVTLTDGDGGTSAVAWATTVTVGPS